jgi:hypothetical protein
MKEIDLTELLPDIVHKSRREGMSAAGPVFLTISPSLPSFHWNDNSLEDLLLTFVGRAISTGDPEKPIRVAAARRMRMDDIEAMLNIHPSHWIQMRIDLQSPSEIMTEIQERLRFLGYKQEEAWVTEDSNSRLVNFSSKDQLKPPLVFYVEDRKTSHRYSFLIPIYDQATAC